ncbi:hypothetical protein Q5741_10860 [Paenibacillus sp. JX-17]|uniref:Uncharacterized protein n=1 Tax=Paenibacillus lacisoli TaxID=3064525 RepID=A0ABT9CCE1_9BACL|nr:hypothetical protein [Paenibacillus sp. JX-17]MDO7906914.1 hypothetical protein [Paenibacillus sp. JX-17]
MYYIKEAGIRRITEVDGVPCAEVEVHPGAADDPQLLVYVARTSGETGGEGYEIKRLIRNDADLALDWYDNSLHSAFEDVTAEAFTNTALYTAEQERGKFLHEVLGYGNLRQEIGGRLQKSDK